MSASVGIALFAKAPVPGMVKTRLVPPLTEEEAAEVARASLEHTIRELVPPVRERWRLFLDGRADPSLSDLARTHGLVILPQAEGDLGVRIRAAFRALRAEGALRVLAIGSDSPTLDPRRVIEACAALLRHDVVIGPAEDGGYYLVGLREPHDALFDQIPWGTQGVTRATLDRARAAGLTVHLLPAWYDLDDTASLRRAYVDLTARRRAGEGGGDAPLLRALELLKNRFGAAD